VKRKGTTKKPEHTPSNFEELKSQYLMGIMAVLTVRDVPDEMIVNWDQTAVKYIPVSNWTMAKEGSKRVEVLKRDQSVWKWQALTISVKLLPHLLPH